LLIWRALELYGSIYRLYIVMRGGVGPLFLAPFGRPHLRSLLCIHHTRVLEKVNGNFEITFDGLRVWLVIWVPLILSHEIGESQGKF